MKMGEIYNCTHLQGEDLTVVKEYSGSMFSLESDVSGIKYLAAHNIHCEPHLCLAHIADEHKELKKKESSFKW